MIGVVRFDVCDRADAECDEYGVGGVSRRCRSRGILPRRMPGCSDQGTFTRQELHVTAAAAGQRRRCNGKQYILLNALGSPELADGKYLYNPATKPIEVQWVQGIGSEKAAAPQARLMATVINGILHQQAALGAGAAGRLPGDCGGAAGDSFAVVRGGSVSFDRDDAGDFCGRHGAVDGRSARSRRPAAEPIRRARSAPVRCMLAG